MMHVNKYKHKNVNMCLHKCLHKCLCKINYLSMPDAKKKKCVRSNINYKY